MLGIQHITLCCSQSQFPIQELNKRMNMNILEDLKAPNWDKDKELRSCQKANRTYCKWFLSLTLRSKISKCSGGE